MDSLFKLGVVISVVDKLSQPIRRMIDSVTSLEKTLQRGRQTVEYGQKMAVSGALIQGAADTARGALFTLLEPATRVQDAMAPLRNATTSTMGSIAASMAASKAAAVEWSRQHVQSAEEFVTANYMMASAGLNDIQAIEGTRAALAVATATMGDQAEAANLLATLYNNVGDRTRNVSEEMTRLGDIVTYTQQVFQFANFGQLNEGLKYAIPAAMQYGSAIEEVSVVLGQLNNAGLQGSMAGTAYAASMRNITKAAKALGFAVARDADGGVSFIGTLENIRRKFGDFTSMSDKTKMAFQQAFGDEGLRGISVLLPQIDSLKKNLKGVGDAVGITARAQAGIESAGSAPRKILQQNIDALKIQIGDRLIPVLNSILPPIKSIVTAMSGFAEAHPGLTKTVVLIAAIGAGALAILAPILTVGSGFMMMVGYGIQGFGRLGQAMLRLNTFLTGGGIARGIRAISSGFETMASRGMYAADRLSTAQATLTAKVRSAGTAVAQFGRQAIGQAAQGLRTAADAGIRFARIAALQIVGGLRSAGAAALQLGRQAAITAATGLRNVASSGVMLGRQATLQAVTGIRALGLGIVNLSRQAVMAAVTALPPLIASTWAFTTALLANPITWVIVGLVALGAAIVALARNWDRVRTAVVNVWNVVRSATSGAIGAVISYLQGLGARILGSIQGALNGVLNWVGGLLGRFKQSGAALWDAFVQGLKSVINKPVEAVKGVLQSIRNLLPFSDAKEGPLSTLSKSGAAMVGTFQAGVQNQMPGLKRSVAAGLAAVSLTLPVPAMAAPVVASPAISVPAFQTPAAPEVSGAAIYDAILPRVEAPAVSGIIDYPAPKVSTVKNLVTNALTSRGAGEKGSAGKTISIQQLHLHVDHIDSAEALWTSLKRWAEEIGG